MLPDRFENDMKKLNSFEILALGFMTFALFLGAGNIIVPAEIGMKAGSSAWLASIGFLMSAVSLPLMAVVALARVGGGMTQLTSPIGKIAGLVMTIAVYLAIGPLFATPRTAAVSFEIGLTPFFRYFPYVNDACLATTNCLMQVNKITLLIYSVCYFGVVLYLVLTPSKIIDRLGKFLTPILLFGLVVLGISAILLPAGAMGPVHDKYQKMPFVTGFLDGYLTMDALAALVFGLVITNAIRSKGITDNQLITRYAILAGMIATVGLSMVYLAQIYLGAGSFAIAEHAANGGQILAIYVQHTFGNAGSILLMLIIILACLTTAVGLLTACGEFFSTVTKLNYRTIVIFLTLFSWLVSNVGLTLLLKLSIPILIGLYPLAITLIVLSIFNGFWNQQSMVFVPTMFVAFIFGIADGLNVAGYEHLIPHAMNALWGMHLKIGWVLPVLLTFCMAFMVDKIIAIKKVKFIIDV